MAGDPIEVRDRSRQPRDHPPRDRHPRARYLIRSAAALAEVTLVVLSVLVVVAPDDSDSLRILLCWDGLALIYLVGCGLHVSSVARHGGEPVTAESAGWFGVLRAVRSVAPGASSMVGLVAALNVLLAHDLPPERSDLVHATGVTAIVLAWMMLHISMAQRYVSDYLRLGGGLEFQKTTEPTIVEFAYFSFTIGASFATSDVEVTDRQMRWTVLVHSVLGFFYNAVVLAVAFQVITGS